MESPRILFTKHLKPISANVVEDPALFPSAGELGNRLAFANSLSEIFLLP